MSGSNIDYKFGEDKLLDVIAEYIDTTYTNHHYSKSKIQATEFIRDSGHIDGFCVGNILKYAQRYKKKGTPDDARKDIMKIIHYAIILLDAHDREFNLGYSPPPPDPV